MFRQIWIRGVGLRVQRLAQPATFWPVTMEGEGVCQIAEFQWLYLSEISWSFTNAQLE